MVAISKKTKIASKLSKLKQSTHVDTIATFSSLILNVFKK